MSPAWCRKRFMNVSNPLQFVIKIMYSVRGGDVSTYDSANNQ